MNLKKFFSAPTNEPIRDKKAERNLFARRTLVAFIGILALSGVLFANIYHLQVVSYETYQTRSNGNRIKLLPLPPTRGLIYDRYGELLAENLTFFGLYIVPEKTENLDRTFEELRYVVGLTDEDIEHFKKERRRGTRYTPILLKPSLTEEQIARFAVNMGKLGIERYYEEQLHGTTGFEEVEINNRGKVIRKLREQPATAGKSIHLTIDFTLQRYIMSLLSGQKGAVVVLDPKDNSVLAMVSTPSYDNNLFVDGISSSDYKRLLEDPTRPLYSRATQGVYPPASTVKPFVAVAALTEGVITPNTTIFDPGYWTLPNSTKRFRDWKKTGHGYTDLNKAITESSDTFFYQTAFNLGIDRFSMWMKRFGFGMPTGIEIQEEATANMPSKEWKQKRYKRPWVQGDTISVGIGQGYWTATPLQVAKATSIVVNNGKIHTPHLMKSVEGATIEPYQDPLLYEDITDPKQAYWDAAKRGMFNVVNSGAGTGRKAFIGTNYHVAGKSGTAQVFSLKENQKYNAAGLKKELHDHAWFTAYAPYEDPKLVVTIILENAGGGSSNAAPIVRQIMDFYLNKRLTQIEHQQNAEKEKMTNQTELDVPTQEPQPSENE